MKGWFRARREKSARPAPARLLRVSPEAGGASIAVTLKRNPRARRLVLTVDPGDGAPKLAIPPHVSIGEAQAFLDSRVRWLERRLKALPPRTAFCDGATIPFLGGTLTLSHAPGASSRGPRGATRREGDMLRIACDVRHLARRASDWLKRAAREELARRAGEKAALLGRPAPRVAIRDPRRQWGSCSAGGVLRLSWRLVLAPEEVLDYVVAHEVAHLVEMNHGRKFWAAVARLTPHMDAARAWLRRNGHGLLRYG
ncbi:MAG: M48 family metallopeptidase [Rhodospirillales bacterium]